MSNPEENLTQREAASGNWRRCPRCHKADVQRRRLPFYLRPLRLVGIGVRAYCCGSCEQAFVEWGARRVPHAG